MSLNSRPHVSPPPPTLAAVSFVLSLLHPVSLVSLLNLGKVADSAWLVAASRACCKEAVCRGRWKYRVAEQ